jgi:hypothetical protein
LLHAVKIRTTGSFGGRVQHAENAGWAYRIPCICGKIASHYIGTRSRGGILGPHLILQGIGAVTELTSVGQLFEGKFVEVSQRIQFGFTIFTVVRKFSGFNVPHGGEP